MAIESEIIRKQYSGNGSTTSFSFPYLFHDATDLDVYLVLTSSGTPTLQSFVADYDVTGAYDPDDPTFPNFDNGGNIVFVMAPSSLYTVVIVCRVPDTQDTSLTQNANYSSQVLEDALDKIVLMVQYLYDKASRSVRLADGSISSIDLSLPGLLTANGILAINSTGTGLTLAAGSALAQSYVGAGAIPETSFTMINNQGATNVTGLLFGSGVRSAEIDVQFYRSTTGVGATEMSARCKYLATYKSVAGTWDLSPQGSGGDFDSGTGQPAGVTLSITSAGQVQYATTNFTGTLSEHTMHFRANTMGT